jgi:twinkle protein
MGDFVAYHRPCPECGGSDPVSINQNGSAKCFSCGTFFKDYESAMGGNVADFNSFKRTNDNAPFSQNQTFYHALTDRSISLETAKKYGVRSVKDESGRIIEHHYPAYINNEEVATKIRRENKVFNWIGSAKGTGLFGQQIAQAGGKYITVTEGECDAMAAYELLGSKWPVVSVKNGAQGAVKDVQENLEFLESFDTVVISFDNDKPGREASKKVARILKPGKAKILSLPTEFKDPNEMLKLGHHKAYVTAWWASKLYTPSGILNVSEERESYKKRERKESVAYPWQGLNEKLEGLRQGELITLTGGTGLGKSSVTRELEHWLITNTNDKVGVIALEEDWRRTVDGILSIEANDRLHIDSVRAKYSEEEIDNFFNVLYDGQNKNRVFVHAHLGMNDVDSVFSKLRFMAMGLECKWIVFDHLHMLLSMTTDGDERRNIDSIMHNFRTLVEETGVGLILVSHLRRIDGNRGHENGIETGLNHLRGSQSIAQLSDCVISLERNQQSEDPVEASTTRVRVLKSRYTGDVGLATHLFYDKDSGRLSEISMEVEEQEEIEL